MTVRFIDKYLSLDLAGNLSQDLSFVNLSPDPTTGELVWNAENKYVLLGKIAGNIDNSGTPLAALEVSLSFSNLPSSVRGFIVIDNTSITQYNLVKSPIDTEVQWDGDYSALAAKKNILEFIFEDNILSWRSYTRTTASTLATFENGTVTFRANSSDGIDDSNYLTPYRTIEHAIREMRDKIPHSNVFPNPGGGFSNDRVRTVRFELSGTFNEAVSIHFVNDYAIEFVGMGATAADTIIFGDAGEAAISLNSTNEVKFSNLTINSDFMCVNALNSKQIHFSSCNFIVRSTSTPRNIFFLTDYCKARLDGIVEISGNIRRFINCTSYSSAKVSCQLSSPNSSVVFSESFLYAATYSFIDASSCTLNPSLSLEGVAVQTDDIAATTLLDTPFSNLT